MDDLEFKQTLEDKLDRAYNALSDPSLSQTANYLDLKKVAPRISCREFVRWVCKFEETAFADVEEKEESNLKQG